MATKARLNFASVEHSEFNQKIYITIIRFYKYHNYIYYDNTYKELKEIIYTIEVKK